MNKGGSSHYFFQQRDNERLHKIISLAAKQLAVCIRKVKAARNSASSDRTAPPDIFPFDETLASTADRFATHQDSFNDTGSAHLVHNDHLRRSAKLEDQTARLLTARYIQMHFRFWWTQLEKALHQHTFNGTSMDPQDMVRHIGQGNTLLHAMQLMATKAFPIAHQYSSRSETVPGHDHSVSKHIEEDLQCSKMDVTNNTFLFMQSDLLQWFALHRHSTLPLAARNFGAFNLHLEIETLETARSELQPLIDSMCTKAGTQTMQLTDDHGPFGLFPLLGHMFRFKTTAPVDAPSNAAEFCKQMITPVTQGGWLHVCSAGHSIDYEKILPPQGSDQLMFQDTREIHPLQPRQTALAGKKGTYAYNELLPYLSKIAHGAESDLLTEITSKYGGMPQPTADPQAAPVSTSTGDLGILLGSHSTQ